MSESTHRFISELIRAANEVDKTTKLERANLLRRAAGTIRDLRDEINFSGAPANDSGPGDIVFEISEIARLIDLFSSEEAGNAMLEAAGTIKDLLVLLDEKQAIVRGE
jgi:hypothetical protein